MTKRLKKIKVRCVWEDCDKIIEKVPSAVKEHNFCSMSHRNLWLKGRSHSEEHCKNIANSNWIDCWNLNSNQTI